MMPSFTRSLRAIERRRGLGPIAALAVATVLAGLWAAWLGTSTLIVYETSEHARVEADEPTVSVDPPVAGTIVENRLTLGRSVARGDVLVVLDATELKLRRAEVEQHEASLTRQLAALDRQVQAERALYDAAHVVTSAATTSARARREYSRALGQLQREQQQRTQTLGEADLVSRMDYLAMQIEGLTQRHDAHKGALQADTEAADRQLAQLRVRTHLQALGREQEALGGQRQQARATLARLTHEVELRTVRATTSGRVVAVMEAPAGSFVDAGQALARIVSDAGLRIVADFEPTTAVGRIAPGQRAQLRVDNFPWTQFGTVPLTVTRVASDPVDGLVRVQLEAPPHPSIPLRHGLTGLVEVEVESISPALLVLRAAGQVLEPTSRAATPPATSHARVSTP